MNDDIEVGDLVNFDYGWIALYGLQFTVSPHYVFRVEQIHKEGIIVSKVHCSLADGKISHPISPEAIGDMWSVKYLAIPIDSVIKVGAKLQEII